MQTLLYFLAIVSVRVQPKQQNRKEVYMKRFVIKNWFMQLWRPGRPSESIRLLRRAGWDSSAWAETTDHREFFLLGNLNSSFKAVRGLNEAPQIT